MMMDIPTLKAALAEKAARRPCPVAGQRDLAVVREAIADEIARLCTWAAADHVRETHSLSDIYGLGGIGGMALAMALEERLGLGELDFTAWLTVGDVVAAVSRAPVLTQQR